MIYRGTSPVFLFDGSNEAHVVLGGYNCQMMSPQLQSIFDYKARCNGDFSQHFSIAQLIGDLLGVYNF